MGREGPLFPFVKVLPFVILNEVKDPVATGFFGLRPQNDNLVEPHGSAYTS